MYHLGGGTLSYDNPHKVFLNFRNSLWTIVKNQKRFLFALLFIRMALDGMAALQFLAKGKPNQPQPRILICVIFIFLNYPFESSNCLFQLHFQYSNQLA